MLSLEFDFVCNGLDACCRAGLIGVTARRAGNADGSGSAQPLIENVMDLQLLYGTASNANKSDVQGYLTAQQIDDPAGPIVGTASASQRWALVKTVRLCILMVTEISIATSVEAAQYRNCNATLVTNPPDLKLRRAYTTTVFLPNRKESP